MPVGKKLMVKVMGIINTSPESFYKGSVKTGEQEIAATARQMQEDGAHMIDIGGMSTAPYAQTVIVPIEEEKRRYSSWRRRNQRCNRTKIRQQDSRCRSKSRCVYDNWRIQQGACYRQNGRYTQGIEEQHKIGK